MTWKPALTTDAIDWYHVPAHRRSILIRRTVPARVDFPPLVFAVPKSPERGTEELMPAALFVYTPTTKPLSLRTCLYAMQTPVCLGPRAARAIRRGELHPIDAYFSTVNHAYYDVEETQEEWRGICETVQACRRQGARFPQLERVARTIMDWPDKKLTY